MVLNGRVLLLAALVAVSGCAVTSTDIRAGGEGAPILLAASAQSRVSGQAAFEGVLQARNGCVVVASNGRDAVPIFDHSVAFAAAEGALIDSANGVRIGLGERFRASSAHLRESGSGWDIAEIETHLGVDVPPACGDRIVRLRHVQPAD